MDEILQKLLDSELLSEDSRAEISEQFVSATKALREELTLEVRAELVEQWTDQRDALIQNIDEKVTEMLGEELDELKEDISRFRDLEVEYADKLVGEKRKLAEQLATEIDDLVDKLDAFLEFRINEEMAELKEDLDTVRENEFGRRIFEAYMSEFNKSFVDENAVQAKLAIAEDKLSDAESRLYEMEQDMKKAERTKTMESVLKPLSGSNREKMELILQNVETNKLQEGYNMFVGRILKEQKAPKKVEVVKEDKTKAPKKAKVEKQTTVVTGNEAKVTEVVTEAEIESELDKALRLAGVK